MGRTSATRIDIDRLVTGPPVARRRESCVKPVDRHRRAQSPAL